MSEDWNRNSLEWDLNINFSHITENPENKALYTFAIINNEKGKIQRLQAKGWMLWDKADNGGYADRIDPITGKSAAKKEDETGSMYSYVPVGMAGGDKPCDAYLMYMPNAMYKERIHDVHVANAKRQVEGVTIAAQQVAASKGMGGEGLVREVGTLSSDVKQGNS